MEELCEQRLGKVCVAQGRGVSVVWLLPSGRAHLRVGQKLECASELTRLLGGCGGKWGLEKP